MSDSTSLNPYEPSQTDAAPASKQEMPALQRELKWLAFAFCTVTLIKVFIDYFSTMNALMRADQIANETLGSASLHSGAQFALAVGDFMANYWYLIILVLGTACIITLHKIATSKTFACLRLAAIFFVVLSLISLGLNSLRGTATAVITQILTILPGN